MESPWLGWVWLFLNTLSAVGVVFVNKMVFTSVHFEFPIALSAIHTLASWAALSGWKAAGKIAPHAPAPVAVCAYLASLHAGYMVLSTLSLALNTVSFYQVCKIASTPVVILLELVLFKKVPRMVVCVSVLCVCAGIAIATINDPISIKNVSGMVVGLLSTVVTALFNIQAGALQRQTGLNSQQLLVSYTPYATGLLATMVLVMEPCGLWPGQGALINKNLAANLFRFNMTSHAAFVIISSAVIGVAVSLTTFLAIAGTSTLTYSVVGHMKTLLVLLGALLGLGEEMPWKRGLGICAAFGGIVWYTLLVTLWREEAAPAERKTSKDDAEGDEKGGLAKRPGWQAQALLNSTGTKHTSTTTTVGSSSSPRFRVAVSPVKGARRRVAVGWTLGRARASGHRGVFALLC